MANTSLPKDPVILYSYINTKLRDDYKNLHELADDLGYNTNEIKERLAVAGFKYDPKINQFR